MTYTFHDTALPAHVQHFTPVVTEHWPDVESAAVWTRGAGRQPPRRVRVGALATRPIPAVIGAQITARASGCCEIMDPACTYQQAAIFSRRRRSDATTHALRSAADGIASCGNCLELIEHTDLPTAFDLGYLVNARTPTPTAAMLWRQDRWVFLDTRGRIQFADPATAHAAS